MSKSLRTLFLLSMVVTFGLSMDLDDEDDDDLEVEFK